jgi:predicted outer membrane repeat protein
MNGGKFVGNKATSEYKAHGGAIAHQNAKLNISNTVFENNYAKTYGNAIYASGSEVNIKDSVFKNHKNCRHS